MYIAGVLLWKLKLAPIDLITGNHFFSASTPMKAITSSMQSTNHPSFQKATSLSRTCRHIEIL